jgi:ABC-type multidrug transport system fused ATPase/permease subunit
MCSSNLLICVFFFQGYLAIKSPKMGQTAVNATIAMPPEVEDKGEDEVDDEEEEDAPKLGFCRLLDLASPQKLLLVAGSVALLIRLPFSLAVPHFVADTLAAVIGGNMKQASWSILCLVVAGSIDAILDFWNYYLFGFAQQRLIRDLRLKLFSTILGQEMGYFDKYTTGYVCSRLQGDTNEMANDLTFVFRWSIESTVRITGITAYLFYRDWQLAAAACGVIPICAFVNRRYGLWLQANQKLVQTALAETNSVAQETISSVRTIFSFAREAAELSRYAERVGELYRLNMKQLFMQSVYYMYVFDM